MSDARVVILDGTPPDDGSLAPILSILTEVFGRGGGETRVLAVRDMRIAHCIGCFGCWVETPGICVENDEGREIARAVARSEVTVLFTPVSFGGYSSDLKRAMDHFIPLVLPYFRAHHGETHHPPRYASPRLVAVGVQGRLRRSGRAAPALRGAAHEVGAAFWHRRAAANGVARERLLDRPWAAVD